ncbi:hypothetical protein GCM10023334_064000 [Nonomuraea thailandensis]
MRQADREEQRGELAGLPPPGTAVSGTCVNYLRCIAHDPQSARAVFRDPRSQGCGGIKPGSPPGPNLPPSYRRLSCLRQATLAEEAVQVLHAAGETASKPLSSQAY